MTRLAPHTGLRIWRLDGGAALVLALTSPGRASAGITLRSVQGRVSPSRDANHATHRMRREL